MKSHPVARKETETNAHPVPAVNVFVAEIYTDQWYVGKMALVNVKDREV